MKMELEIRSPYVDNWAIFLIFAQCVLIGLAYYRSYGSLFEAILEGGKKITLGSRIQLDGLSQLLLHINVFLGLVLFVGWHLVDAYYLNSALLYGAIIALGGFILWNIEYFIFWSLTPKSKWVTMYVNRGNVFWFFFGIALCITNAMMVFNQWLSFGSVVFLSLFLLALILRILYAALLALTEGIRWYYIILYLCTVFLLPLLIIKRIFGAYWLELLTH